MMKHSDFKYLLVVAFFAVGGCSLPEVNVSVVSERTTLENQVLGSYQSLSRDFLLVTSVRGVDSAGGIKEPLPRSGDARDTSDAVEILAFHQDDLDLFKALGWVGENRSGLLTLFPFDAPAQDSPLREDAARFRSEEVEAVVRDINSSRMLIMRQVINRSEDLRPEDLPQVQEVFGSMNREKALEGERIESAEGVWSRKGSRP